MSTEENIKVLVIVDDLIVRESIATFLSQQGYRVSHAAPSENAVECFHSFVPDLVLCDIHLNGEVSLDIAQEILKASPAQTIIIIADKVDVEDVIEAMKIGVSDYFFKPVDDMAILDLAIKSNLKRARIIGENRSYHYKLEVINQALETTLERYEADQQAGRHIQVSMLPKPPQDIGAFHFNHRVIPSLYLSGDSVDYKPVTNNKVLFYIADVSGHGSSSAFVTVLLRFRVEQIRREYIRARFANEFTPASILVSLNEDMLDSGLDKHITMFVGILDSESNTLTYSVAGHHPLPVCYSSGKASFIEIEKSSFPIGLLDEAVYFDQSISLAEDFALTLFSDGILEILAMETMVEKEQKLLDAAVEAKGDFESIKSILGLNSIGTVPDDIAVMSVNRV